jgi:SAM-dependent methyltransferase
MGIEIDLLRNYPKSKRNVNERGRIKTQADRDLARKFDVEFFDGDRSHGYGGFNYDPRFWQPVIPDFVNHFNIGSQSSILDVGCAKGFMLFDFTELVSGVEVRGIDISGYAVQNCIPSVKPFLDIGDAKDLPYENNSFDFVISINTVHNLDLNDCAQSLREIERVSKHGAFITVDAYHTEEERERMEAWNLTALTFMHVDEWKKFFDDVGYTGDYYWFIP